MSQQGRPLKSINTDGNTVHLHAETTQQVQNKEIEGLMCVYLKASLSLSRSLIQLCKHPSGFVEERQSVIQGNSGKVQSVECRFLTVSPVNFKIVDFLEKCFQYLVGVPNS